MKKFGVLQTLAVAVVAMIPLPGIAQTPQYYVLQTPFIPATITDSNGGKSLSTIYVFPLDGFTGNITFTCTITGVGQDLPTCSAPPSVNITAGSSGPFRASLEVNSTNLTPGPRYFVQVGATSDRGVEPAFQTSPLPVEVKRELIVHTKKSGGGTVALVILTALLALSRKCQVKKRVDAQRHAFAARGCGPA